MISAQMAPNQGLPDIIRVKVVRGFRGLIDGQFGVANPGDVVEVPRGLAMEMRGAGRAVMTNDDKHRDPKYLPERKRAGLPADPVQAQLAAMTKALEGLQKVVEALTTSAKPAKGG